MNYVFDTKEKYKSNNLFVLLVFSRKLLIVIEWATMNDACVLNKGHHLLLLSMLFCYLYYEGMS